jgi:hypothetical protein
LPSSSAIRPSEAGRRPAREFAAPSVTQRLGAIRHLFDRLVIGEVVPVNPAASMRRTRHVVVSGARARPTWASASAKINRRQCEAAHTSSGIGELLVAPSPAFTGGCRAVEGAMMRTNLWSESVPRVELDQRSRAARLRRERIDRLLIPPVAVTQSRLRRLLGAFSFGI